MESRDHQRLEGAQEELRHWQCLCLALLWGSR